MSFVNVNLGSGPAVRIPLPLDKWRSVTFQVMLGECAMGCHTQRPGQAHYAGCPARPVKVSCSISGKTWEESEVTDAWPEKNDGFLCSTGETFPALEAACRARWLIVKALVLGRSWAEHSPESWDAHNPRALFAQRDTVYLALVDVVRAEEMLFLRGNDALRAATGSAYMRPEPGDRESATTLARYVDRLVEQVSTIEGVA